MRYGNVVGGYRHRGTGPGSGCPHCGVRVVVVPTVVSGLVVSAVSVVRVSGVPAVVSGFVVTVVVMARVSGHGCGYGPG